MIDAFFKSTKSNDISLHHSVDDTVNPNKGNEYDWIFRHTVSYWISISFIFGSLLFSTASIFLSMHSSLTQKDKFVLITVAFFAGNTAFLIASFFGWFEVINIQNHQHNNNMAQTLICNQTINYWTALVFVIGSVLYQISVTCNLLQIQFESFSFFFDHFLLKLPIFLGGIFFFIGGVLEMYLNECWYLKPRNIGWIISWLNGIAGFFFFIAGIGIFFDEQSLVSLYLTQIPWIIGSLAYLFGSIGSLLMWKLHQFGLVYLPKLNKNYVYYKNKSVKVKKGMILYRDIFFLVFYVATAASGITAMSYSLLCGKYADWFKNFLATTMGSIAVLTLGSVMHIEAEKEPYSYLTWFLRFYMVWLTTNTVIDAYDIAGSGCEHYGILHH